MRELGARAKEENAEDSSLPPALARPFDAGELDRMLDGATAKLNAPSGTLVPHHLCQDAKGWGIIAGVAAPLPPRRRGAHPAHAECDIPPAVRSDRRGGRRPTRSGDAPEGRSRSRRSRWRLVLVLRSTRPGHRRARARVMIDRDGTLVRWDADRAPPRRARSGSTRAALPSRVPAGLSTSWCSYRRKRISPQTSRSARKAMRGEIPNVQTLLQPIDVDALSEPVISSTETSRTYDDHASRNRAAD